MADKIQIGPALLDVRKAYRLIYLYQEMALGLCQTIVKHLESDRSSMNFYYWTPSYNDSPPRGSTDPINRKSFWDFIPLYDFCVFYLPAIVSDERIETHKPGDWMLVIRILADSTYDTAADEDPRAFTDPPASCESLLRLYIYFCDKAFNGNWYGKVYNTHDYPSENGEVGSPTSEIRVLGMEYPLVQLGDPEGVRDCVEDYVKRLKEVFPNIGSAPSEK